MNKVIVLAYACDPSAGSEPGAGGAIALSAARTAHRFGSVVHILTRSKHVRNVEDALIGSGYNSSAIVEAIDAGPIINSFFRDGGRLHSLGWQLRATRRVRFLVSRESDVVVHHVTFASDVLPSAVHLLGKRARTVWGPVGSSEATSAVRRSRFNSLVKHLSASWFRFLAARVSLVVCQTSHVRRKLGAQSANSVVEQNCIVDTEIFTTAERDPRVVLFIGRLIERKQPELAIQAAEAGKGNWRLSLIGEGPLRGMLETKYAHLIANGTIRFEGQISRSEVLLRMVQAGGLLHPAKREGAPWAVAEAISAGLWVVALAGSGADALVDEVPHAGLVVQPVGRGVAGQIANSVGLLIDAGQRPRSGLRWSAQRFDSLLPEWYFPEDKRELENPPKS